MSRRMTPPMCVRGLVSDTTSHDVLSLRGSRWSGSDPSHATFIRWRASVSSRRSCRGGVIPSIGIPMSLEPTRPKSSGSWNRCPATSCSVPAQFRSRTSGRVAPLPFGRGRRSGRWCISIPITARSASEPSESDWIWIHALSSARASLSTRLNGRLEAPSSSTGRTREDRGRPIWGQHAHLVQPRRGQRHHFEATPSPLPSSLRRRRLDTERR